MIDDDQKSYLLGFLSLYEMPSRDGYIGSVLVTDIQSLPLEFKCTHPIKPNIVQKTLYGNILEKYIGIKLCGIPLLKSLQNSPSLIIVNRDFLLDIRKEINYPVTYIRREEDIVLAKDEGPTLKREKINVPNGRFESIIITYHPAFEDEISARDIIENILYSFDPLEPFDRMNKVIEVLRKEDKRFQ